MMEVTVLHCKPDGTQTLRTRVVGEGYFAPREENTEHGN